MCTAVLTGRDPATPPPPAFGLIYEGAIGQPRFTTSSCELWPPADTQLFKNAFFLGHGTLEIWKRARRNVTIQNVKPKHGFESGSALRKMQDPDPHWGYNMYTVTFLLTDNRGQIIAGLVNFFKFLFFTLHDQKILIIRKCCIGQQYSR